VASSSTCAENEGQIVHVVGEAAARRDLHFFQGRLGSGRSAGQRALCSVTGAIQKAFRSPFKTLP
jgi:hypothetical protein